MTSNSITISSISSLSTYLYFKTQPASTTAGSVCAGGVILQALMPVIGQDTVNTGFTSLTIALSLITQSGSGSLSPTSCTAVSGTCTISSCPITGAGTFIFKASGTGYDGYSAPFTVTSGSVSTVTLNSVSTTVYRGQAFTVTASVVDSTGAIVNQALQFYLQVSSGTGQIVQGSSAIVSLGTLTFNNVIINKSGSQTLTVTCSSCSAFTVNTITVTVNVYGQLLINFPTGVLEGESSQYYTLSLSTAPSASVSIAISSANTNVLSILTQSITFTTANYNTAQKVYFDVGIVLSSANPYSVLVSHSVSSDDWTYSGTADMQSCMISSGSISIPIYVYQEVSVNVDMTASVSEDSQVVVSVYIASAPTNDVTIALSSSSSSITLSVSKLIFTSTNWAAQYYTITGPASGTVTNYLAVTVSYTISTSDSSYSSASVIKRPSSLTTTVIVTPKAAYSISLESVATTIMSKNNKSYYVRLSDYPTSSVSVSLSSSSSNLVVSPSSLTFSTSSALVFQEVIIYAVNASPASSPSYVVTVTHTASSSDSNFNGKTAKFSATVINVCLNLPYDWPSADVCSCPAGFNCQGNNPIPCAAGTYNLGISSLTCTACPAGSSCADPGASPVTCTSGYYSYDYYTACYLCPPGFICPDQNGYKMTRCVQGTYAGPGSTSCTVVTPGNMAPSPEYALAIACPTGYYSQGSKDLCAPCPGGFSCSLSTATACSAGTYSLPGMGTCNTCPDHHECDPAIGPSRICPEGTYRPSGAYNCQLCPAGSYCSASQSTRPVTCPSGNSSTIGSSHCSSTTTYSSFPGVILSGSTITACTSTNYTCFVGTYNYYTANILCSSG